MKQNSTTGKIELKKDQVRVKCLACKGTSRVSKYLFHDVPKVGRRVALNCKKCKRLTAQQLTEVYSKNGNN